jgi:hypothetical protein
VESGSQIASRNQVDISNGVWECLPALRWQPTRFIKKSALGNCEVGKDEGRELFPDNPFNRETIDLSHFISVSFLWII